MGTRCIKIYLNPDIPEEAAILVAWDSCPEKRRSALARSWLLGAQPKPNALPEYRPAHHTIPENIVPFDVPKSPDGKTPLERATDAFLNAFGK